MSNPIKTEGRDALQILTDVFGYRSFRDGQEDIMRHVIDGNDALVLMPTGGGKSLCYQVPALARCGLAVVVSPLLALMHDQVVRLRENGVAAERLNSEMSYEEQATVTRDVIAGRIKILYVAPERLVTDSFQSLLKKVEIGLFAIDEAHCVSQWGHSFRKEYMQIGEICSRFPGVPRIAVTATASPVTRVDMIKNLHLEDARVFLFSFDRPNIAYSIVDRESQSKQLLEFMADHKNESGVVYCLSRRKTEETAALLRENGYDALHYHAGLDTALKSANLDRFLKGEGVVAVATIAFGMGIDKPDVRFVAHLDLPESLEAYYQETGRAGRDGLPAVAWMSCGGGDLKFRRDNILKDETHPAEYKRMAWGRLQSLMGMIGSAGCRRGAVLRYFGETHSGRCGNCDRCLNPVSTFDGTTAARMILSAAHRTGERYGGGHLVEVLTGAKTEKIGRMGHDKLPTFGVGKDHSKDWWTHVVQQVYTLDLLSSPPEMMGGYRITAEGRDVLRGGQEVRLVEPPKRRGKQERRVLPNRQFNLIEGLPEDKVELFESLRQWRSRLAKAQNLPPYAILHDTTLAGIVAAMPDTLDRLGKVGGIGGAKLARYGTEVLSTVAKYRKQSIVQDQITVPGFGRR